MPQLRDIEFICNNKTCSKPGLIRKNYVWTDRDKNPNCINCGEELEEVILEIRQSPAYLKFASGTLTEKKAILKKRSRENNLSKEHQEKRKHMYDNNIGIGGGGV